MNLVYYDKLTQALLDPFYFPRKKDRQLCCIVDTNTQRIYPVPVNIEHIDFVSELVRENVKENPSLANLIIPSNLIINSTPEVLEIATGYSGMESGFGVRHTRETLETAEHLIKEFAERGDIAISPNLLKKIDYRYTIK